MKEIIWNKDALETIRGFSSGTRIEIGALLRRLQRGEQLRMPQSRPMKQLGRSAFELRIKDRDGAYRIFYVLFDANRIFIPHAFIKKSQKTSQQDIETGLSRLKRLIDENK